MGIRKRLKHIKIYHIKDRGFRKLDIVVQLFLNEKNEGDNEKTEII